MAGDKTPHTFDLTEEHVTYINDMVKKHDLPDAGKAIRALLDYAIEDGDDQEIFGEIRCLRC